LGGGLFVGRVDQKTVRNVTFSGFAATIDGDATASSNPNRNYLSTPPALPTQILPPSSLSKFKIARAVTNPTGSTELAPAKVVSSSTVNRASKGRNFQVVITASAQAIATPLSAPRVVGTADLIHRRQDGEGLDDEQEDDENRPIQYAFP